MVWASTEAVIINPDGSEQPLVPRTAQEDHTQFAARSMRAVRVCPGPGDRHYVPYQYGDYGEPIIIGLIGESTVGKTLLLTAMLGRLQNAPWLDSIGVQMRPLDAALHQRFAATHLEPFLKRRAVLDATPLHQSSVEFTYATTLHHRDGRPPVAIAFFDVSGDRLRDPGPHNAFLSAVNALIFVVDSTTIRSAGEQGRAETGDSTFELVIDQLNRKYQYLDQQFPDPFIPIPAAIVVGKADRLTYDRDEPTKRWFGVGDDDLELSTISEESADVYAFLASRGGGAYLKPALRLAPVTLHYASATNCQSADGFFPSRSFRQRRVLKPLLSLLVMKGVLDAGQLGQLHG
ncbi:hypothetical protein Rhe02_89460 [Rhizocola hellebori]|uniref:AAA+ ATPase domain-containing protein n=1 Tax=Rhizocola hellebori TaxID=1392758 RepID=A0A8J3QJI6_9ACTN|nr:hypothetical protein Rhe02_89460 [Rhizocola hellebori]